jgi:HAD superfamily hydrolase (TIGR01450 family)
MARPPQTTVDELLARYDGFLIDAYGVLVHSSGPFPGARRFVERLEANQRPFCVITNDASRLPSSCARKYRADGIDIDASRVITSASLLAPYLDDLDLEDAAIAVLGPPESREYVTRSEARLVDPTREEFDVLVICDESGYEFIHTVDETLTRMIRRIDRDDPPELILPNPDLIYQRSASEYGITSGSVAAMFESILDSRYPGRDLRFTRLGKPHPRMFERGIELCGTDNVVVLGDQLETDIRGANDAGLDSVLVATGLDHGAFDWQNHEISPDYILPSLDT